MKTKMDRCPYCQGFLEFSFVDNKDRYVYRCTRCTSVDERLFLKDPLREVEVSKVGSGWVCNPPKNKLAYGWPKDNEGIL